MKIGVSSYSLMNIRDHLELAYRNILNNLDAGDGFRPYFSGFSSPVEAGRFRHMGDGADLSHNVGRAIDALLHIESVTGTRVPEEILDSLSGYLYQSFDNDAHLNGYKNTDDDGMTVHPHDVREALNALSWLIRSRNDIKARDSLGLMLKTLDEIILPDGLFNTEAIAQYKSLRHERWSNEFNLSGCMHKHGRWMTGLLKVYEATGSMLALDICQRLVQLARKYAFDSEGKILHTAGGHGHSITGGLHGMCWFGRLTGDAELLELCRRIFTNGIQPLGSSFGFSLESVWNKGATPDRGEINNTGDLIQAAMNLGEAGFKHFYEIAERYLRSTLLPCQQLDTSRCKANLEAKDDSESNLPQRLRGGWTMSRPNDRMWGNVLDLTCGAAQALCEVCRWITAADSTGTRINLLFDNTAPGMAVKSLLPLEGSINIEYCGSKPLFVRIPGWVERSSVLTVVNGETLKAGWLGTYIAIPTGKPLNTINITFPVQRKRCVEVINHCPYEIELAGDVVTGMSPSSEAVPNNMYDQIDGARPMPPPIKR
jgi:hypothetical protein